MSRKIFKLAIVTAILTLSSVASYAQLHMSANIQTNHLWRGGEVADGFVVTADASINILSDQLTLGVWGATNGQGTYKEFNYFAQYSLGGFSAALWDTYNFADYATYNNEEFFNYDPATTGRFLDATLAYRLGDAFPLRLSWSTILFGRDRNEENSENRFSTFCYVEYPIYNQKRWRVDAGLGGAFALNPMGESANFYGDESGVVHLSMVISREVEIGKYSLPISFTTMWNPQSDKAYFQLAARLFSF